MSAVTALPYGRVLTRDDVASFPDEAVGDEVLEVAQPFLVRIVPADLVR